LKQFEAEREKQQEQIKEEQRLQQLSKAGQVARSKQQERDQQAKAQRAAAAKMAAAAVNAPYLPAEVTEPDHWPDHRDYLCVSEPILGETAFANIYPLFYRQAF
jgi:multidrug efflux pump subunit AcrA (membrane-fusion protein)